KGVDAPGSSRFVDDQPGVLQQAQMPRYCRPADRQGIGYPPPRVAARAEQFDDGAAVRVPQGVKWVAGKPRRPHAAIGNVTATVTRLLPICGVHRLVL